MGVEMECFGLKMGSGFAAPGGTPPAKFTRITPSPPSKSNGDQCVIRGSAHVPESRSAVFVSTHVWKGLPSPCEEGNDGVNMACVYVPVQPWRINVSSEGAPAYQGAGEWSSLVRMGGEDCHRLMKRVIMA